MRAIAQRAGVSLGLTTYHYKTKRQIAVQVMQRYLTFFKDYVAQHVSMADEPLVHSAAMVRLCVEFFMSTACKKFYLECLTHDIYMESLQNMDYETMRRIAEKHRIEESSPDLLLFFSNYMPPYAEKILLLGKEKGNFSKIPYEQIPEIIFAVSVERFLSHGEITAAAAKGRELTRKIRGKLPENLSETLFQ